MGDISLSLLWIECGFLGTTRTSSLGVRPRVASFCPPSVGLPWSFGLVSLGEKGEKTKPSVKETVVFKAVVLPTGTALGTGSTRVNLSGWTPMNVNLTDSVEVALAARVQHAAMTHIADSTSEAYVGPCNLFVKWCGARLSERFPLPASNYTVALYLQSVSDGAKTFAPVKSASSAIAYFRKGVFDSPLAH